MFGYQDFGAVLSSADAGVDESDAADELALIQCAEHVRTGVMLIMEELRVYGNGENEEAWH